MSGLALVCARLGATVTGSDRADSSYMERLRAAGLEPAVGHDAANLPEGAEVVVSTAIGADNPELALARERGVEPIHRGALLAELCAEKRLIAIAGTHGKTTTTAMVVWALRALGADPAFFVGGEVPGLGPGRRAPPTPAGARGSGWSPRPTRATPASSPASPRSPSSPTSRWTTTRAGARWPSCTRPSARFAGPARGLVAVPADEEPRLAGRRRRRAGSASTPTVPGPADLGLAVPGDHNRPTPAPRWRRSSWPGFDVDAGGRGAGELPRRPPAPRAQGLARRRSAYTTTTPTTRPRSAPPSRPCASSSPARLSPSSSPTSTRGPRRSPRSSAPPSPLADEVVVLDVYPAREEPVGELAGVSGLQVAQAAAERAGGRPVWWLPERRAAAARPGRPPRPRPGARREARSWSRSAPATSSGSARRWSTEEADERRRPRAWSATTRWPG